MIQWSCYNPKKNAIKPARKDVPPISADIGALLTFIVVVSSGSGGITAVLVVQGLLQSSSPVFVEVFGSVEVVGSGGGRDVQEAGGWAGAKYGFGSFLHVATGTELILALLVAFKKYGAKCTVVFFISCCSIRRPALPEDVAFNEADTASIIPVIFEIPSQLQSLESRFHITGTRFIAFAIALTLSSRSPNGGRKSGGKRRVRIYFRKRIALHFGLTPITRWIIWEVYSSSDTIVSVVIEVSARWDHVWIPVWWKVRKNESNKSI